MNSYDIGSMKGKKITQVTGLEYGSDEVSFEFEDGAAADMWHEQDCCETVQIEDVVGDVADLIDAIVLDAREESGDEEQDTESCESSTWTFYIIQTNKGAVTIRWLGTSNGFYSESVSFRMFGKRS